MWLVNQPSAAARIALVYITIGALGAIWTCVWALYLHNHPPESNSVYYLCAGCFATGVTLMAIGLGIGQIGRSARHADLPAEAVVSTAAQPVAAVPAASVPAASVTGLAPVSTPAAVAPVAVPAVPVNPGPRVSLS